MSDFETFTVHEECPACDGTGIYTGLAENDGIGVVCHTCKGTGEHLYKYAYKVFEKKKQRSDIKRVIQYNPGIMTGKDSKTNLKLENFGGMTYSDWFAEKPFPKGSEMRRFSCPTQWYRDARKPNWSECVSPGCAFSSCKHFKNKNKCWQRWDKENN